VHDTGIVPNDHVADRPLVAIDELRLRRPGLHLCKECAALFWIHARDTPGSQPKHQRLAPRPVRPNHGVNLFLMFTPPRKLGFGGVGVHRALDIFLRVHHPQRINLAFLLLRQVFIGCISVGEFSLAAFLGKNARGQERSTGGDIVLRPIEVPEISGVKIVGRIVELRVKGDFVDALVPLQDHIAERPGKCQLLLIRQVELAEQQHAAQFEQFANLFRKPALQQRFRAGLDLSPDAWGQRLSVEFHLHVSCSQPFVPRKC
jgi:hypothetical protein